MTNQATISIKASRTGHSYCLTFGPLDHEGYMLIAKHRLARHVDKQVQGGK